jgi:Domain of unknown function (DUF1772)
MGFQQSAWLCLAVFARDSVSNFGIPGFRSHRRCALDIGGTVILASWPYAYFVVVPVNIWLCAIPADAARSAARELMRDWGLLEWGQTAIGFGACCVFAWALALPA